MTNTRIQELISSDNFKSVLTNELYALIDEEMAKDLEMDCDLIDELVNAIEQLEQCEDENLAIVIPILFANGTLLSNRIRNKYNGTKLAYRITAVAAAVAILLTSANSIPAANGKGESVLIYAVNEFVEQIERVFDFATKQETPPTEETTTEPVAEETTIKEEESVQRTVELMGIELITKDDFKTSYLWRESLDLSGLKIMAIYSDGGSVEIPAKDCEITGFNNVKIGKQTITVKYKDFSETFIVNVSKTEKDNVETRQFVDVECSSTDTCILPLGTENPVSQVKWRYVYSDGTFTSWKKCDEQSVKLLSTYDNQLTDIEQILTYSVPNGMTFTVTVILYDNTVKNEKKVTSMQVFSVPDQLHYVLANGETSYLTYVGEECDFSKFVIDVWYSDRTNEFLTLSKSDIKAYGTMTTDKPSPFGGYKITFAYGDCQCDFYYSVIVRSELTYFEVNQNFWRTYHVDYAPNEFDATNLIYGRFSDTDEKVVLDVEVKGYDPKKVGLIELEVYYQGEYLCDTIAGWIYENNSYVLSMRPVTEYSPKSEKFSYIPSVAFDYYTENGHFVTLSDICKRFDIDTIYDIDDSKELSSYLSAANIQQTTTLTSWDSGSQRAYFQVLAYDPNYKENNPYYEPSPGMYFPAAESLKIKEYGEYEISIYLYNTIKDENGQFVRTDADIEFTYTLNVKEAPISYKIEAPKNLLINIQDIYTEFYDKVKVYAVYADGRQEETNDYNITRFSPSYNVKSDKIEIVIHTPDVDTYKVSPLYVYSDGYENSWFIEAKPYKTYFNKGETLQANFNFHSAKELEEGTFILSKDEDFSFNDTSKPGKYKTTVIYNHPVLGKLTDEIEYVVKACDPSIEIVVPDGINYNPFTNTLSNDFKVIYTDLIGEKYEITDYEYSVTATKFMYGFKKDKAFTLRVDYTDPYSNENVYKTVCMPSVPVVFENITAKREPNGDIILSFENDYSDSGKISYSITAEMDGYTKRLSTMENINNIGLSQAKGSELEVSVWVRYVDENGEKFPLEVKYFKVKVE